MLSIDPDARPRDPLAFYRRLQDCLTEVEQRETRTRPSGVPISRTGAIGMPARRRIPMKALARATLFLAMAALAALVVRGYLRHRRVVRAEEPIGVPIGVSEALASATPANAKVAHTMVSIATPSTPAVANANTQAVPARSTESDNASALTTATDFAESASPNQVAVAPAQPATSNSSTNPQTQETAAATATNASTPSAAIDSSELAATSKVETAPTPAVLSGGEASAVTRQTAPKKIIMHEVRRAEPAEPEVRRAEPAPPEEGPAELAPDTTASPSQQTNSAAQTEQSRDGEDETAVTKSRKVKRADSEPTILLKVPRQGD